MVFANNIWFFYNELKEHIMDTKNKENVTLVAPPVMPVAYQLELHRLIEREAYLRAEADGFSRSPMDYWLVAEKDIKI